MRPSFWYADCGFPTERFREGRCVIRENKSTVIFLVWFVTRLMIFLTISRMAAIETDIEIYHNYAGYLLQGLLPYKDFPMEYPPGAILCFIIPKLLTDTVAGYRQLFVAQMMLVDLLGLILVMYYGRKRGYSAGHGYAVALLYVTLPAVIGLTVYQRFDFVPAVLVLAAVILAGGSRRPAAWALLGLGFAVKLYPVILAPVFLLQGWRQKKLLKRDLWCGIPLFFGTVGLIWLPFLIPAGGKFWFFLEYHSQRGIQLESFYSTMLLVASRFGYPVTTEFSFGSWNTVSGLSPFLARISLPAMACLMLMVLMLCYRSGLKGPLPGELPRQAFLMIAAFIIGGKVFSPQYLVWLIPLLVLSLDEISTDIRPVWGACALLTLLTFLIYPINYRYLMELSVWPIALLAARNGLLLAVFYRLLQAGTTSRQTRNISEI